MVPISPTEPTDHSVPQDELPLTIKINPCIVGFSILTIVILEEDRMLGYFLAFVVCKASRHFVPPVV